MPWITIRAPKTLYLPTGDPRNQAFKDTGLKVEPTDTIEIEAGTHNLRVNGKVHYLFIPCDKLKLDEHNVIRLDKPAPPVASLASGNGRAHVGRQGEATQAARGDKTWTDALNQPVPDHVASDTEYVFENLVPGQDGGHADHALDDERQVGTVKLRDGSMADALLDPRTKEPVTVWRTYSGVGTIASERDALIKEQNAHVRVAVAAPQGPQPPPPGPIYHVPLVEAHSTNNVTLNGLLKASLDAEGFPIGKITHVAAPTDLWAAITTMLRCPPSQVVTTLEAAFIRIHTCAQDQRIVIVKLDGPSPTPTDQLRLSLGEHLPVLLQIPKNVALVLLTPVWGDTTPSLLNYLVPYAMSIVPYEQDPRFWTATVTKTRTGPLAFGTATFPAPTI